MDGFTSSKYFIIFGHTSTFTTCLLNSADVFRRRRRPVSIVLTLCCPAIIQSMQCDQYYTMSFWLHHEHKCLTHSYPMTDQIERTQFGIISRESNLLTHRTQYKLFGVCRFMPGLCVLQHCATLSSHCVRVAVLLCKIISAKIEKSLGTATTTALSSHFDWDIDDQPLTSCISNPNRIASNPQFEWECDVLLGLKILIQFVGLASPCTHCSL